MIGRQLGLSPSQPPKLMVTEPSSFGLAVMLLTVFALRSFGSK